MNTTSTRRKAANLPGCHGTEEDGLACDKLRIRGHLYCPACEAVERKRMRAEVAGD